MIEDESIQNQPDTADEDGIPPHRHPHHPEFNPDPGPAHRIGGATLVSIVILSLLAGLVGGLSGAYFMVKHAGAGAVGTSSTTRVVSQDSAVIQDVAKASPAVVSIVISKSVSQIQNENSDPFSNPFFFDPFFENRNPGSSGGSSSAPNTAPQLQEVGAGSGFLVSSDGLIVTNKHVVSDTTAQYTVYTNDGKNYNATVLSRDPLDDLALVKIDVHNAPTLKLAQDYKLQIGEQVIAIGNSLGQYSNTVTTGIVSGIGRNITAGGEGTSEQLEGVIQTDAAINPGNSGGPLLNIDGDVIGINTAIDQQGQLVGFAIPVKEVATDIASYNKFGKIVKPFLGVRYVLIDSTVQQQYKLPVGAGAWLTSQASSAQDSGPAVVPGGAADKAGLKDGDIITAVNGTAIDANNSLAELVKNYNPGDTITVDVLRSGKTLHISVTLGQQQ